MFAHFRKYDTSSILLALLFFCTPLIFSHVFSLIGISIADIPFGYERYKIYFLVSFIFLVGTILYLTRRVPITQNIQECLFAIFITGGVTFYWIYFQGNSLENILIGTTEKHHGILFFLALL